MQNTNKQREDDHVLKRVSEMRESRHFIRLRLKSHHLVSQIDVNKEKTFVEVYIIEYYNF